MFVRSWWSAGAPAARFFAAGLFIASCLVPTAAEAQYFGRNKVQYDTFDFEVLETEHFDIYYYEDGAEIVEEAGRMAERWYARLSRLLDHQLRGRQALILYTNHPDFEQTNAIFGEIGESTGGVTEVLKRRIVLPLAGPLKESDHVIGHELVHAFQFDMTSVGGGGGLGFRAPTALSLPLWFIEGMAEYLSVGAVDPHTAMWMRDAAACGCRLPTLGKLNSRKYFPYRWGQAFWAYVAGNYGDESIGKILKVAGRSGNPQAAIETVLQTNIDAFTAEWHQAIIESYSDVAAERVAVAIPLEYEADPAVRKEKKEQEKREGKQEIDEDALEERAAETLRAQNTVGKELLSSRKGSGGLNLGPALSPDGSRVAFLSEKSLFSIELFIADAETGEIQRRLTKTATDPHFESLQFINSSGAWRPDGRGFAFATIIKGKPAITIVDPDNGDKLQEIAFEELGEIYTPSYSPDGRRIVFAAVVDGYTDLFVVDLETERLERLTNDLYSDLQPAWSPDGATIAFVTDRFTTDLSTLEYGSYRIGLIEIERDNEILPLPAFGKGKHIDPQWAADSQSLYFVTDVSGISNVYRYEFAGGNLYKVTNLYTGVSGITALSPAIAVASSGNRLVYTAFQLGDYDLYSISDPADMAGTPIAPAIAGVSPGLLPPKDRSPGLLNTLLEEPELGLPEKLTFDHRDYQAGLTLDYVSQPQVGGGVDRFGTVFAGGISMYFSDMLGNRNLSAIGNINTSNGSLLRSSTLLAAYENRRTRWNWSVEGGQIPYVTRSIGIRAFPPQPELVEERQLLQWQISRQLVGGVTYPFNRNFRAEGAIGYQNIDFAFEERSFVFDPVTGQLLAEDSRDLDAPPSLNLGLGTAALVYDNTLFGGTGPILGQRYRVELSPRLGDLQYNNVLGDFRKYVMPFSPVTFAGRALHFGRYGGDAEDGRLNDLYLGFGSLVRGYNDSSFGFEECEDDISSEGTCPVFDQLFGSRLALMNLEMRVPLLG
ncbi:MAG: hypothetical protein ACR2GQ_08735, partial [Gemmatimonadota bacterium]